MIGMQLTKPTTNRTSLLSVPMYPLVQAVDTPQGVAVEETGKDSAAAALIQAHAAVVSEFVKLGMTEAMRAHPLPSHAHSQPANCLSKL